MKRKTRNFKREAKMKQAKCSFVSEMGNWNCRKVDKDGYCLHKDAEPIRRFDGRLTVTKCPISLTKGN